MAETTSTTTEEATRGRPYYEKLRTDLKQSLEKKRELDKTMDAIESSIARAENQYLEETSSAGNIIKGFDNYIKASSSGGGGTGGGTGTATRRKGGISDQDRIFSRSSVSWTMRDSPAPLGNLSATPSESATPVASARDTPASTGVGASQKAGNKKKKAAADKDKDKDKDDTGADSERPAKRGKISWGRE